MRVKFSNFDFFKETKPELYKLAYRMEHIAADDPLAAMVLMKQLTNKILDQVSGNNGLVLSFEYKDDFIHSLWKNELIAEDMYLILREIELFDSRESIMMIEVTRVDFLISRVHDFAIWFYKTYVDEAFVSNGFLQLALTPQRNSIRLREENITVAAVDSYAEVDGHAHQVEWMKSLLTHSNYKYVDHEGGEKYEGQIVRGLKHGEGMYTWQDGTVYTGWWDKDQEHGYGEKRYANGDVYRGEWKNGLFDGRGTYSWKDGSMYEGQWQDSFEHGFGTRTDVDGVKRSGYWTYGEYVKVRERLL